MDVPRDDPRPNPYSSANFFSKLVLYWFWPIFQKGYKKPLKRSDIWDPPEETKASRNVQALERAWAEQRTSLPSEEVRDPTQEELTAGQRDSTKKSENSEYVHLLKALWQTFGVQYLMIWPLMIFNDCFLRVIQPWFMLQLVRSFIIDSSNETEQYLYAAGICISTLILTLCNNPSQFYLGKLSQRCRIALCSLIERQVLRLSHGEEGTNEGQIANLITNDGDCIERNIPMIPYLFVAPIQLIIFMWFLFDEFGMSSIAGLGFILLYMPFQYGNGTLSTLYRNKIGRKTDVRARVISEVIDGIMSVKMYAWENIFKGIIHQKRKSEVKQIKRRSALHAFQMSIFLTSSRVVPFLTFVAFVLSGGPLTADRVFYAVAVYNTVTHFMVFMLPGAIRGMGEIKGSLQRIEAFLLLEETPMNRDTYVKNPNSGVVLSNVSARYKKTPAGGSEFVTLSGITCEFPRTALIMIVGKVGSGKSSLLKLILNELHITEGQAEVSDSLSYASQEPYLITGSIRRNILFKTENQDVHQKRYDQVIDACGLASDIPNLSRGHDTPVVSLSGGQKARVNLARAIYHKADVYLLDDPLSAVDAGVSRHIVDNCISSKGFLQDKLRILVTHQLQYLNEADHIIVMDNFSIAKQGTYDQVKDDVERLLGQHQECVDVDSLITRGAIQTTPTDNQGTPPSDVDESNDEEQGEGSLGLKIYWKYFKSGKSNFQLTVYILIFLVAQIFTTLIEYWLAIWTNAEERMYEEAHENVTEPTTSEKHGDWMDFENFVKNLDNLEQHLYLYMYLVLTSIVFLTNLLKAVGFFYFATRISTNIHEKMLASLLRAKPEFFEKNDSGRIMNRFTRDIGIIDTAIPFQSFDMYTIFLQVGTVILLIIFGIWQSFVAVILFLLALGYVRRYYVTTSRDLKRIDGTTKSPVIAHLQGTFAGLVTVRALKAEGVLSDQFDYLQDQNTSATISFLAASQCFNIWIEVLATLLLTVVAFGFLIAQNFFEIEFHGGNVGLAICSAVSLTIWLQYGMKVSADVENLMVSVERAIQYTKLDPEKPLETTGNNSPPTGWPSNGSITFRNVTLSYNSVQDILQNLNFDIYPKEKIGVVGKTGAGKSSILRALFRMTEIKMGEMVIDKVNISGIGLHELRRAMAIIPQQPHLFKGPISFNLDPSIGLDGAGLTEQLQAKMRNILQTIGWNYPLDKEVEAKGSNLSPGERQLVSLARALITPRRIVALDEATAQIDSGTDQNIQRTLKTKLADCTVITIAHRLGTVIESDRILVISEGRLAEFGHAHELLQDPMGQLTAMVNNTGNDAAVLRQRAEKAYNNRQSKGMASNGLGL